MATSESVMDKITRASIGDSHALQALATDEDELVRAAVARRGYAPEIFVNDPEPSVRFEVAMAGHELETLIADPAYTVRMAVAHNEHGLGTLVNDEHWEVRAEVAGKKYGLDKLASDPDKNVRKMAEHALGDQTLDQWIKNNPERCALPENRRDAETAQTTDRNTIKISILGESAREQWTNAMNIYLKVLESNLDGVHNVLQEMAETVYDDEVLDYCDTADGCIERARSVAGDMKSEVQRLIDAVFDDTEERSPTPAVEDHGLGQEQNPSTLDELQALSSGAGGSRIAPDRDDR